MIIGLSGWIGSGKDTVAKMIQYLVVNERYHNFTETNWTFDQFKRGILSDSLLEQNSMWQIKKFAGKLKQICSILTGIPVEQFEQQSVKDSFLGPEWDYTHQGGQKVPFPIDPIEAERWKSVRYQMKVRDLLQKMGTDAMRNKVHPNVHINALFTDYKPLNYDVDIYPKWIISDLRFPNEAEAIKQRGGFLVRVNRPDPNFSLEEGDAVPVSLSPVKRHESETALDNYKFDWVIDNDEDLENLLSQVAIMLKESNLKLIS